MHIHPSHSSGCSFIISLSFHCEVGLHHLQRASSVCVTHLSSFPTILCHRSCPPSPLISVSTSSFKSPCHSITSLNGLKQRGIVVDFIHVIRHNYINGFMNGFHKEPVGFVWGGGRLETQRGCHLCLDISSKALISAGKIWRHGCQWKDVLFVMNTRGLLKIG